MRLRTSLTVVTVATSLLLTACGGDTGDGPDTAGDATSQDAGEAGADRDDEPDADAGDDATDDAGGDASDDADEVGSVTLAGSNGDVDLEAPAERIVALEWTYVEDLLALGVQPVGVADREGYETWVDVEPELDDDVADVGTRQEPSLESIAALDPDLIIGAEFRHEPIIDQLEAIAPTVLFDPYPAPDGDLTQFTEMTETFTTIATAANRTDEAEQVLSDVEATFDDITAELDEADLAGQGIAMAQGFTSEEAPTIRMFTENAMAVEIVTRLGLTNAWPGEPEPYGFNTVDAETLTRIDDDAFFLYVAQDDDNIFTGALADNPVWQDLDFVQADRVRALGPDTWLFGGPLSAEVLARDIADALTDGA